MKKSSWFPLALIFLLFFVISGCDSLFYFSYQLDGQVVVEENGQGLEGVNIYLDGVNKTVTTDENGYWSATNVDSDVVIHPAKDGWNFSPVYLKTSSTERNLKFVASETTYQISGKVFCEDGFGVDEVGIYFNKGYEKVTTNPGGYWEKEGLVGEVKLSPVKENYIFVPKEVVVSEARDDIEFTLTGDDDDPVDGIYSIGGFVLRDLEDEDSGIPNVIIKVDGEESAKTGSDGGWIEKDIEGKIKVEPELEGWHFNPGAKIIDLSTENKGDIRFEGTPENVHEIFEVSGTIRDNTEEGVPHLLIEFWRNGEVIGTAVTDEDGNWQKSRLWNEVVVVPQGSPPGYEENFAPESITVTGPEENVDFIVFD